MTTFVLPKYSDQGNDQYKKTYGQNVGNWEKMTKYIQQFVCWKAHVIG